MIPLRLILAAMLVLAPTPAMASVLPPMDLARGEVAVSAGLPVVGADVALGRFALGASAFGLAVPTLGGGYGFVGRFGWRLTGLPRRELCVGIGAVGGNVSGGGVPGSFEGWFVHPGFTVALPIGKRLVLRALGGPLIFTGVRGLPSGARDGAQGFLPFVPNVEVALRFSEEHELTVGGLPGLVGWRGRF